MENKFESKIQLYESVPVVTGKILLYGHSLFTRCSFITKTVGNPMIEQCLRMKNGDQAVVNHGFGTSTAADLLYYYDRMVRPYKPRLLVLATATNDILQGVDTKQIISTQSQLIEKANRDFPNMPIYCFSAIPTLKHKNQGGQTTAADEYNKYLNQLCDNNESCRYICLYDAPFYYNDPSHVGDRTKLREDIFTDDNTHFNPLGYTLFIDYLRQLFDDLL